MWGMRDDDGFTAAEGWIDEWEAGVVAFAARAQELARRLRELGDNGQSHIKEAVAETVGLDSALGRAVMADRG